MALLFESLFIDFLVILAFLIICLFMYSKYFFTYWERQGVAQMKPLFLFGDIKELALRRKSVAEVFTEHYNYFRSLNEPFGGIYFSYKADLVINDLDLIKRILQRDFDYFTDRGFYSDENIEPLTANLFALDGSKWKNMRMKLTPTFTSGKMKMMFHTLVACTDELRNILEESANTQTPIDIKDLLARFTTDVIGSCAFGIECNCLKSPNTDFRKYGTMAFEPTTSEAFRQLIGFIFPSFLRFFKINILNKNISKFFLNIVKQTVQYREENNVNRKDFLQLLLQIKNHGKVDNDDDVGLSKTNDVINNNITIEQIAAQCFIFFLAGFETSSTTMTFCLFELANNQKLQQKLRDEINAMYLKHNGKLTYEGIMEMPYLEKVINETLRKYPPLPFLSRKCTKDYTIPNKNITIKRDTVVRIPILGIQRDPEYYPDPEKFDPERFSDEEKVKRHPFTYLPFGEGPRICIGLRFGLMQTKVGLSVLLKDHRFTVNPKTTTPLVSDPKNFILSTKGGIWLDAYKV